VINNAEGFPTRLPPNNIRVLRLNDLIDLRGEMKLVLHLDMRCSVIKIVSLPVAANAPSLDYIEPRKMLPVGLEVRCLPRVYVFEPYTLRDAFSS
jgi:hypothetical protein